MSYIEQNSISRSFISKQSLKIYNTANIFFKKNYSRFTKTEFKKYINKYFEKNNPKVDRDDCYVLNFTIKDNKICVYSMVYKNDTGEDIHCLYDEVYDIKNNNETDEISLIIKNTINNIFTYVGHINSIILIKINDLNQNSNNSIYNKRSSLMFSSLRKLKISEKMINFVERINFKKNKDIYMYADNFNGNYIENYTLNFFDKINYLSIFKEALNNIYILFLLGVNNFIIFLKDYYSILFKKQNINYPLFIADQSPVDSLLTN